jgi:hypothetical protein
MESHAVTDTIEIRQDSEETTLEELLPINPKLQEWKAKYPISGSTACGSKAPCRTQASTRRASSSRQPVAHYMALERGKKGDLVTSWSDSADFQAVSDNGFVKIDCLGIKGLAKHDYACKLIKKRHGIDVDLNALGPLRNPLDVQKRSHGGIPARLHDLRLPVRWSRHHRAHQGHSP